MFQKPHYPKGKRFYPTFVLDDVVAIFIFMAVFSIAVFLHPEWIIGGASELPADPFNTPEHIKPEWYFLASYQFLKLIPELPALAVQTVAMLAFVFLPFIDRGPATDIKRRPLFLAMLVGVIIIFIGLTIWGAKS